MAMVIAERCGKRVKVSKSTYEKQFKNKGYKIVGEVKNAPQHQEPILEKDDEQKGQEQQGGQNQNDGQNVDSIPISEMNKEQLIEYAKLHNIDTSSAKNVKEARKIIQEAVKESKM